MQRVMIVGGAGSGKSTLARRLGKRTGLPVHHLDHLHWKPGWEPRDVSEKIPMVTAIEMEERWIIDEGLSAIHANRAARADTLVWLDLPMGVRLWRVTWRTIVHWGRARQDMPEGCVEGLHAETVAFYRWIWQTRHSHKCSLRRLTQTLVHLRIHRLPTARQVARFLKELE